MTISYSCDRKRGIFVYTPSKDKDKNTICDEYNPKGRNSLSLLRDTIEITAIKTED